MKRTICLLTCCFAVFFLGSSCSKSMPGSGVSENYYSKKSSVIIDGVTWATMNVGATNEDNWGICGTLFTYDNALKACPEGWRLPTKSEIEALQIFCRTGEMYGVKGVWFSGSTPYKDYTAADVNAIFIPLAGFNDGFGWKYPGSEGYYWYSAGYYYFKKYMPGYKIIFFNIPPDSAAYAVRCVKN